MMYRAHAKINWYLKVLRKRPDGYHELEMLNQRLALCDELDIEPAEGLYLDVRDEQGEAIPSVPSDDRNLVIRAAQALQTAAGVQKGARIRLLKRIPSQSGLAGGSADAAAALHALNRLWELNYSLEKLQAIGLRIGADVPYCLTEGPAIVKGLGEIIRPLYLGPSITIVLLVPPVGLSTGEVFAGYDRRPSVDHNWQMDTATDAVLRGHFSWLRGGSGNSLQRPASMMLGAIPQAVKALRAAGASFAQMSGAGSTVFGAFTTYERAKTAHEQLSHLQGGFQSILTHTLP